VFLFLGTITRKYNPVDVNHARQVWDVKRYLMARLTIGIGKIAFFVLRRFICPFRLNRYIIIIIIIIIISWSQSQQMHIINYIISIDAISVNNIFLVLYLVQFPWTLHVFVYPVGISKTKFF